MTFNAAFQMAWSHCKAVTPPRVLQPGVCVVAVPSYSEAFISHHTSVLDLMYTVWTAHSGESGGISDSESWYGIAQARAIAESKEMNGVFHFSLMRTVVVFGHRGEWNNKSCQ